MVNLTAINLKEEHRCTPPIEAMVDTGSELSWLPKKELQNIGITSEFKKQFIMANKQTIEGFGVMVDNIGHRFVSTTFFVC